MDGDRGGQDGSPSPKQVWRQHDRHDASRRRIAPPTADGLRSGLKGRLKTFLATLPQRDRLVFLLRYADDLQPVDIGLIVGESEDAVSSILRRIEMQARFIVGRPSLLAGGGLVT